jgi:hypothetical protein
MFVGMDVHKDAIDVSLADEGREGEVRHFGPTVTVNNSTVRALASAART